MTICARALYLVLPLATIPSVAEARGGGGLSISAGGAADGCNNANRTATGNPKVRATLSRDENEQVKTGTTPED